MSCGIRRILQFNSALKFGRIRVYDINEIDITKQCKYSWSTDMVCWTNWTDYDKYVSICKNIEDELFIRVLLYDSFSKVSINDVFTKCYSICVDNSNPLLETFCDNENLFKPYANLDCALLLQHQLSDSIICMFGIPVYYFQVKPDPDTADYTFKEYALHNVTKVKQIKLMIPDGQMPSSNPKFSALDFDWELDWDVELSKTEFAVAFGDTEYPKVRDFIYIPLMKRMWEVNSAYDERNESLMWRSSTWKLSLVKYEDSTNVAATEDMTKLIDDLCGLYYDDVFGVKEEIQQERETGSAPLTSPTYAATNLFNIEMQDAVRKKYNKGEISVIDYQYNHRSNIVGRTIYKFKKPESTLVYQNGYCGEEGTLTFIIQTQGQGDTLNNKPIITMGPVKVYMNYQDGQYNISFNGMETSLKQFSSYLVVLRWSKQTYSCSIQIHEYTHEQDTPIYMLRPEMYWFNSKPCFSDTSLYNLDFQAKEKQECFIQAFPTYMTNIKLFDRDLGENDALKEAIKYTTQNKSCIINDLARHFNDGHGYSVR